MLDLRLVEQETNNRGQEYKVYDIRLNATDEEPIYRVTYGESDYKYISICVSYKARNEQYMPEIYFEDADRWNNRQLPGFKIQTTSYGAQEVEEIDKVIAGYQVAKEVVAKLTEMFL